MLLDELLFSDLFGLFQFLLELFKSRSSRLALSDRRFKSYFDSVRILRRRTDVVDWDLECDRLW
jgi:hypothetical protein